MKHVMLIAAIVCIASGPAFASECEDLPSTGQASVEKKYMKIKAESADADTDCQVFRHNDVAGAGYYIEVGCRVHFRPRNGGCFASYSPSEINQNLSTHPGCEAKWAWIKGVIMETQGTAKDPEGKQYTGKLTFDMVKEKYEVKYKVLVGKKVDSHPVNDTYQATLKQICMRKID